MRCTPCTPPQNEAHSRRVDKRSVRPDDAQEMPRALIAIALFAMLASGPLLRARLAPIHLREPGAEITGHEYQFDPALGWRNIPSWRTSTHGKRITFNAHGLRDREREPSNPSHARRILALGGSYTWGYGVADEEIFTRKLEARLGTGWQVLNAGVSGWSTDQETLYFEQEGANYSPELVLVELYLLGIPTYNTQSQNFGLNKPVFDLKSDGALELLNTPVPKPDETRAPIEVKADRAALTAAILNRLAKDCAEKNCRVVAFKFSLYLSQSREQLDLLLRDQQKIEELTAGTPNLFILDLDRALFEHHIPTAKLLEGNEDGHWNAWGHDQVAEILHQFLIAKGLL